MSSFQCQECGAAIIDSPLGYITSCQHYPKEKIKLEFGKPEHIAIAREFEKAEEDKLLIKKFIVTRERTVTITEEAEIEAADENEARQIAEGEGAGDFEEIDEDVDHISIQSIVKAPEDKNGKKTA